MTIQVRCFIYLFVSLIIASNCVAQQKHPLKNSILAPFNFPFAKDSTIRLATIPNINSIKNAARPLGPLATCNTSTFYMHLKADAGKKINIKETVTLPDGNFLLAGNITLPNTEQEGLLVKISNEGVIISQKQLRVNNIPTTLFNAVVFFDGHIAIAGILHGATDKVFTALLNDDLSINWLQVIDLPAPPLKTSLDIINNQHVFFAAQLSNGAFYSLLNLDGTAVWKKQLTVPGMNDLSGIGHNNFSELTLSFNCTITAKKHAQLITVKEADGELMFTNFLPEANTETTAGYISSFNGRLIITGVNKDSSGQFALRRYIMADGVQTETMHTYIVPGGIDFNTNSAHTNAGDIVGFCVPQEGRLIFIRHFAYYQVGPEYIKEYTVPIGSAIADITRSKNDGGFLMAVNTSASNECLLIKTDSVGILGGCTYKTLDINYTENGGIQNPSGNATVANAAAASAIASITENTTALSFQFDCNQKYCPAAPVDDTCLSSYYKTLRSNSYVDAFGSYNLLRNNRHIMVTARYEQEIGDQNTIKYGLKSFDEKGNFIKGVNIFSNGITAPIFTRPIDVSHFMVIYYSVVNGVPCFTLIKMDEDLQVVWSKSIQVPSEYNFFGAIYSGFLNMDKEGNFYLYYNTAGIFDNAKVLVYKMDANGNPLWIKIHELDAGLLFTSNATTTNTSLVMVLDGANDNSSVSLSINKTTGDIQNAWQFNNSSRGAIYNRLVQFDSDRIFYAGNDGKEQFVMGTFDTTGKPIKLKSFDAQSSIMRSATVKSGKLYGVYNYFNGSTFKDVLLKADTALSLEFIHEFDIIRFGFPVGMAVSDEGNIYVAGNHSYGGSNGAYYDPLLKKYDANGVIGTCPYGIYTPPINDVDLNTQTLTYRTLPVSMFTEINIPVSFVPDTYGQQVSEILCSSTPLCTAVKLAGSNTLCRLNEPFTYSAQRNAGCNLKPTWFYDTAFINLQTPTDSTAAVSFKQTGTTWLKVKLNAGCSSFADSIQIQIQKSPAIFDLGNDTIICKGNTLQLNAGKGFNSYQWQDGSLDSILIVTRPGKYYVRVDNICGDIFSDTINITEVKLPVFSLGDDVKLCKGDTLHLTPGDGFSSYDWQPSAIIKEHVAFVDIFPVQDETITLIATTAEGCKKYDTLGISVLVPKPVSLGNDTSFCSGDSLTIFAVSGYSQYSWSNGSTAAAVTVKQAGAYSVTVIDNNGCKAKDTVVVLPLYTVPQPSLVNNFNLCMGEQKQLDPGNFNTYLWQDGSTARYYNVSTTGTYKVAVTNSNACLAMDSVTVSAILPLPKDFLVAVDSICQYEKVPIIANDIFSSYSWSTGSVQPSITIDAPGRYWLSVKDINGCQGSDTVSIHLKDCFNGIFVPNAFTPNNDLHNDFFKATVYGVLVSFRLEIFNRFGQKVFSSIDPHLGWDGKFKNTLQPVGGYVWQCRYQFSGKLATSKKGTVLLIQ